MSNLEAFDAWLAPDGPVAVAIREPLEPVHGPGAVVFPPTFAPPQKGDPPSYVIDETSGGKTAIIDTVGSQANRMEPLFKKTPYSTLVPQASVKVGEREVNLLDAGHRAADALVRFSGQRGNLEQAFRAIADHADYSALAKLAPTSLVFGVWDSRGVGVKVPRIVGSTVRANGVEALSRSAQYFSAFEKTETDELGQNQEFLSEQGLSDAPAGRGPGGVVAKKIRRDSLLNLIALRAISAETAEATKALQRYILGLALVAITAPMELFLREGCLLVPAAEEQAEREVVSRDGTRSPFEVDAGRALEFAEAAANAFGVGPAWEGVAFDPKMVTDTADKKSEVKKEKKAAKAKA